MTFTKPKMSLMSVTEKVDFMTDISPRLHNYMISHYSSFFFKFSALWQAQCLQCPLAAPMSPRFSMLSFFFKFAVSLAHHPVQFHPINII